MKKFILHTLTTVGLAWLLYMLTKHAPYCAIIECAVYVWGLWKLTDFDCD